MSMSMSMLIVWMQVRRLHAGLRLRLREPQHHLQGMQLFLQRVLFSCCRWRSFGVSYMVFDAGVVSLFCLIHGLGWFC